ncbi:MAG: MurR/RpiR family transcriptional regulator [bacterium]
MLIIDKMQTIKLTDVEAAAASYIYAHRHELENISSRMIAKEVYCSSSAIIRLAQKLGFDGYNAMKKQLIEEERYLNSHFSSIDPNRPFKSTDSIMNIAYAIKETANEAMNDTLSLLHHDTLQKAVKMIHQAQHIYIFAFSSYLSLASMFQMKMSRIHKPVIICSQIGEENYYAGIVNREDLAIVISYSGENPTLLHVASLLKEREIPLLTITSVGENSLSQLGDDVLYLATREKLFSKIANYTSEHSLAILFDILYSCYFRLNYDTNFQEKAAYAKKAEIGHVSSNPLISE